MKIKIGVLAVVLAVLAWVGEAQAQFGMMKTPEVRGVFNPVVGEGASYQFVDDKKETKQFDIAIVDKDTSGGFWTEYTMQDSKEGTVYAKQLIIRHGTDAFAQRFIVQVPGQPPMEISSMMKMQGQATKPQKLDFRAEAQNLGTETITTPAGTFSCDHWRTTKDNTDVWISDKVKPWGLVKFSGKQSGTMTVTKLITNAKTHITGTPVSMEEMMRQRMGKQ
jgi:hypothetical protein